MPWISRTTSLPRSSFGSCRIDTHHLDECEALLARWFRFQPSEIEALTVERFLTWCEQAEQQIRQQSEAAREQP